MINSKLLIIVGSIIGVIGVASSLFLYGYNRGVEETNKLVDAERVRWEQTVNKIQNDNDVKIAEISAKHNAEIVTLNQQINSLKKNPKVIRQYVKEVGTNKVTKGFELVHDRSAKNIPLSTMIPEGVDVTKDSNYSIGDVASTIATNYSNCNIYISRLNALQEIIKNYQAKQKELVKK